MKKVLKKDYSLTYSKLVKSVLQEYDDGLLQECKGKEGLEDSGWFNNHNIDKKS